MIKIISVYETAPFEELDTPKLHVDLEIDGYKWVMGGLPIEWTLSDLKKHLEANYADILRQAKLKPPKPKAYPYPRAELITEFTPVVKEK